jgi:hypothetical protein
MLLIILKQYGEIAVKNKAGNKRQSLKRKREG